MTAAIAGTASRPWRRPAPLTRGAQKSLVPPVEAPRLRGRARQLHGQPRLGLPEACEALAIIAPWARPEAHLGGVLPSNQAPAINFISWLQWGFEGGLDTRAA